MTAPKQPQEFLEAFAAAWSAMQRRPSSTVCDDNSSDLSDESDFSIISNTVGAEIIDNEEDFVTISPLVSSAVQTKEPTSLSKSECVEVGGKIKTEHKSAAFLEELRQRTPRTMHPLATSDLFLRPKVDATIYGSPSYCTGAAPIPIAQYQEFMTCSADTDNSVISYTLAQPRHPENVTSHTGDSITSPFSRNECSHGVGETDKLQHSSSRRSNHISNEANATDSLAEVVGNAGCTLDNAVPTFNAGPPGFLPAITDVNPSAVTQRDAMISDFAKYIRDDLKSLSNTSHHVSDVHDSRKAAHGKTIEDYEARLLANDIEIAQLTSKNREHVDKIEKMDSFLIEKEGDHIWQLDRIIERMAETETVAKLEIAELTKRLRKAEDERDQMRKRLEKAEANVNELTGTLNEKTGNLAAVTHLVGLTDRNLARQTIQLENAETKLSGIQLAHHTERSQMETKHANELAELHKRSEKTEKELKKALTNAEDELEQKNVQFATAESAYKANLAFGRKESEDRITELHAAFDQVKNEMKSKTSELNGARLNIEDLECINKDLSYRLEVLSARLDREKGLIRRPIRAL